MNSTGKVKTQHVLGPGEGVKLGEVIYRSQVMKTCQRYGLGSDGRINQGELYDELDECFSDTRR